jgi:hypothetical protein
MDLEVDSAQWAWKEWPLPKLDHYSTVVLRLTGKQGNVDLDSVLLAAGEWKELPPGQSLDIPAPCFFHAGYTDPATDRVVLQADREPADAVFYGPNMPLGPGRYRLEFVFSSGAPRGTRLGKLTVGAGSNVRGPFQVVAGQNASAEFEVKDNLPVRMDFRYSRRGDIEVDKVIFNRVE